MLCEKHNIESIHKCKLCTVEKRNATMMTRYGVIGALSLKEVRERKNATCLKKYGTTHSFQNEEIKKKCKETMLQKYGVEHSLQSTAIRDKGKETMLQKYGVEHAIQSDSIKQKRIETNIERFGVENALQNPDIIAKRKETNMERYGVEEVLQDHDMQERIKQTMTDMYGASNPLQCESIKAKKDKTCEERYGDKDIMHNAEIFEKVVKNSFKKKEYTLPSGKIITYQGYENVAFDELLKTMDENEFTNDVKVMPKVMYTFEENLHRYYPDIYIPSQKRFIEVKSLYTYNKQLEQNHCKRDQVLTNGYAFEFWICNKKEVVQITQCK